jgi:DHA1 family bicyclomycin/chloramphenicol resistance-like MFS transporter
MVPVFLDGNNLVFGLGAINVAAGRVCLLAWVGIGRGSLARF